MRLWSGALVASYLCVFAAGLLSLLLFSWINNNNNNNQSSSVSQRHASGDDVRSDRLRPNPRTKYSRVPLSEGQLFHLDAHFVRRRARRAVDLSSGTSTERGSRRGIRGVARDCGIACHLRLRSKDTVYVVHLHRWHQIAAPHNKSLPVVPNSAVAPLVVYVDDESHVSARISRTSNDCIYRARVVPSKEHSIVNLCDSDSGLYGLLALPDGIYTVEPLLEESRDGTENGTTVDPILSTRRHRPHAVHRFRSQSFLAFDERPADSKDSTDGKTKNQNTTDEEYVYVHNYTDGTWQDLNVRKARSRRSANSWDHYVEVLVVADQKMLEYHGHNLEDYVLTLFSTVASIYRHQSLRASINIVVVKIVILKHENAGLRVKPNAQDALKEFCRWQQLYNDINDESPHHHDVAILLTRVDICRARDKCDTLGLAELGTMCDRQKSCAIIEDNGLSAAFTIAHEMGHIFNIPHDDERKCGQFMQLNKANFHIMAPTLEYNTHPWSWSPCSAALLDRFLDQNRGQIQCLFDQPVERRYYEDMFSHQAPGRKYDVNQQCKFVFGPQAELCPYMPTCRRLWCATYYGSQMGCRTQHMPWADGTPCDDSGHMFCHRGQCVGMAPEQRSKQDGAWGDWLPWAQCSRTCGGGVQKSTRECDNPRPANGGKYCVGQKERYRSCNTQECPWDTAGFREVQCSEYNNKNVGIHGINVSTTVWVPKYAGVVASERCKLYCRVSGSAAFYLLKDKVIDGTPCDRNGDDICIDGTCMPAGCDHVLHSSMKRDKCGICGGDDTSCKVVKGTFNERGTFGYNEVMKIPAGSANIDIRQHGYNNQMDDDNYLSLRTANGEFLLNGHYQVSVFKQQIPIQDVVLEYSGSENVIERINGTGPIRSDIYLHVLSVGNLWPPDIRYEYMTAVPGTVLRPFNGNPTSGLVHYYWRRGDRWSACDRTCQGKQTQEMICMDATHGRQAAERNCRARKPAPHTRMCNIECTTRWTVEDLSACSAVCGAGQKRQRVTCVKTEQGRQTSVADSDCDQAVKPPTVTHCYVDCSGRRWSYSEWSGCTETCGDRGVQMRKAFCVDGNNRMVDESACGKTYKEQTERECNRVPCPRWVYGHWSECSRSCDGGVRMRHAQCLDAAEREFHSSACGPKLDRETCNEQMCTSWSFGEWSECSVTCGEGKQTRDAICVDGEGRTLSNSRCNYRERIVHKPCQRAACPSWKLGEWTQCSVSCLDGWSTRRVSCVDGNGRDVDMERCSGERPASHKPCNQGPCPFWRQGEWSRCSVSCGKGVRERSIDCIYREQIVDVSFCGDSTMPKKIDTCSLVECTYWDMTPWSACSVSCGSGTQVRRVNCVSGADKRIVDDLLCKKDSRPRERRTCAKDACEVRQIESRPEAAQQDLPPIRWATGPWTTCSASCGKGTQRRLLKCRDQYRDLPDKYCAHLERENDTRECSIRPCAVWRSGPWMPCSSTCGTHAYQTRSITCIALNPNEKAEEIDCDITQRPVAAKSCRLEPCPRGEPVLGNWQTGEWSKCSMSCGIGYKRRAVTCSGEVCDDKRKPKMFDQCNTQPCPSASNTAWQISPWTSCHCESGVQRRRVWCEDVQTFKVVDDGDCIEKKPESVKDCDPGDCKERIEDRDEARQKGLETNVIEEPTQWQTAPWGSCSAKCGRGVKRREVTCIGMKSNTTVASSRCNQKSKPVEEIKCRVLHCPRWRGTAWSSCSVTCGEGVRTREVYCQRGRRQRANDTECEGYPKPQMTARCFPAACPAYHWTAMTWSKCGDCARGQVQRRRVYCESNEGKKAAPRMCEAMPTPITTRPCDTSKCAYEWVPGPWSTCSKTCGDGIQLRSVECRLKQTNLTKMREPAVPKEKCESLEKPIEQQNCRLNPCDSPYQWQIGPWTACSQTCGMGVRRRKVRCEDREGKRAARKHCEAVASRPRRTQTCFERNCLPSTCQEIRAASLFSKDGNYTVLLDGYPIRVYCHLMNETIPRAYINLNEKSNFAEVYGKRLIYPHTCPYGGERNDSCACNNEGDASAGLTIFSKVRVDLLNRKIHGSDFTFARKIHGNFVPYATAGDCYSMRDCPQGKFSLDLRGTGLRIADDIQWEDRGHRTSSTIDRTHNNARIAGRCGGYCGKCRPDRYKGLVFEIDTKQLGKLRN